jgi:RimJ/RimL family protein N-acetyltransferase
VKFPDSYKILDENIFCNNKYSIVPIRFQDRLAIMNWRNEQMYHLRQSEILGEKKQEAYFRDQISQLFSQDKPNQILFSYLKDDVCIGYGGLVHINWIDKNAEVSFIMDTQLEKDQFDLHWKTYLSLINKVAFEELKLHKIFTYAFDIRPRLYPVLKNSGFVKEAVLKEHCFFDGKFIDVVIHAKTSCRISIRNVKKSDKNLLFEWSNDEITRKNSYQNKKISYENHEKWFSSKLVDKNATYYICEVDNVPAGLIRFDKEENHTVIGITLAKEFRGKKIASNFIQLGCNSYLNKNLQPILAFIKKDNLASQKVFQKSDFKLVEELEIDKIPSYLYKYESK